MAKVLVSFRHDSTVVEELKAEAKAKNLLTTKGEGNLNAYLPQIVDGRKNNPVTTSSTKEAELQEKIKKLLSENTELKEKISTVTKSGTNKLAEHYAKRAWDIARITKEQLEKGL